MEPTEITMGRLGSEHIGVWVRIEQSGGSANQAYVLQGQIRRVEHYVQERDHKTLLAVSFWPHQQAHVYESYSDTKVLLLNQMAES